MGAWFDLERLLNHDGPNITCIFDMTLPWALSPFKIGSKTNGSWQNVAEHRNRNTLTKERAKTSRLEDVASEPNEAELIKKTYRCQRSVNTV